MDESLAARRALRFRDRAEQAGRRARERREVADRCGRRAAGAQAAAARAQARLDELLRHRVSGGR